MIQAEALGRRYGETHAISGVSFRVEPGERIRARIDELLLV